MKRKAQSNAQVRLILAQFEVTAIAAAFERLKCVQHKTYWWRFYNGRKLLVEYHVKAGYAIVFGWHQPRQRCTSARQALKLAFHAAGVRDY